MKERIYISVPVTGTDDYLERFSEKECELEKCGYSVINPAAVGSMLPEDTAYRNIWG